MAKMIYQHFAQIQSSSLLKKKILERHTSKKQHSMTSHFVSMYSDKFCSFYNPDATSASLTMIHISTSSQDSMVQNPYKMADILNPVLIWNIYIINIKIKRIVYICWWLCIWDPIKTIYTYDFKLPTTIYIGRVFMS